MSLFKDKSKTFHFVLLHHSHVMVVIGSSQKTALDRISGKHTNTQSLRQHKRMSVETHDDDGNCLIFHRGLMLFCEAVDRFLRSCWQTLRRRTCWFSICIVWSAGNQPRFPSLILSPSNQQPANTQTQTTIHFSRLINDKFSERPKHYKLMLHSLYRDAGYMRIYDRICDHIFCQNSHIAYFCLSNAMHSMVPPAPPLAPPL